MKYKLKDHVTDEMLKDLGFIKKTEDYGTVHYKSGDDSYFQEILIYSGTTRIIKVWNIRPYLFDTLYQMIVKGFVEVVE